MFAWLHYQSMMLGCTPRRIKFSMLKSREIHPEYYGKLSRQKRRKRENT